MFLKIILKLVLFFFFDIIKLVLKIIVYDYSFNFKLKIIVNNNSFNLKKFKIIIINYDF